MVHPLVTPVGRCWPWRVSGEWSLRAGTVSPQQWGEGGEPPIRQNNLAILDAPSRSRRVNCRKKIKTKKKNENNRHLLTTQPSHPLSKCNVIQATAPHGNLGQHCDGLVHAGFFHAPLWTRLESARQVHSRSAGLHQAQAEPRARRQRGCRERVARRHGRRQRSR